MNRPDSIKIEIISTIKDTAFYNATAFFKNEVITSSGFKMVKVSDDVPN